MDTREKKEESIQNLVLFLNKKDVLQCIAKWSDMAADFVKSMKVLVDGGSVPTAKQEKYIRSLGNKAWQYRGNGHGSFDWMPGCADDFHGFSD
jgi:hypothetical protein